MVFHFDARADSSDEDGAFDLTTWTTATKRQMPGNAPAPTAQMTQPIAVTSEASSRKANDSPRRHQLQRRPTPGSISPPRPSFQAINQATRPVITRDDSDDMLSVSIPDLSVSDEVNQPEDRTSLLDQHPSVIVPQSLIERDDFEDFTGGENFVNRVLHELYDDDTQVLYNVLLGDFSTKEISFAQLQGLEHGLAALENFRNRSILVSDNSEEEQAAPNRRISGRSMPATRSVRKPAQRDGFVNTVDFVDGDASEDELANPSIGTRKRKREDFSQYVDQAEPSDEDEDEEDDLDELIDYSSRHDRLRRQQNSSKSAKTLRSSNRRKTSPSHMDDDEDDEDFPMLGSDLPGMKQRKVKLRVRGSSRRHREDSGTEDEVARRRAQRHSERTTRHVGGMQEVEIDDIYRTDSDTPRAPTKPKPVGVREIFKTLPRNDEFRMRHTQHCEVCGQGPNFAPLIDCQGCSLTYHKSCLGHRTNREHLVTKIGEGDFVLQCRRCIAFPRHKDRTAPDQGICQECRQHGLSCRPFRSRKTPAQEQKDREENDGVDPVYQVDLSRINNVDNVLFRCTHCFRGFHFQHLPSRNDILEIDTDIDAEQRFREYSRDWKCKECATMPAKVSGLIAWKPLDEDSYDPAAGVDSVSEDDKAYLVRWDGKSYFQARWMPGAWVWGVTAHVMRKAFSKREDAQHPKMRTEDAIPEDYLRTDIVLDIKFTSIVDIRTEEVDKARIREVEKALIKYKGLSYEDAVWEAPPSPEDGERWTDFVMAYNDWVAGRYVRQPKPTTLKTRLEKARAQDFAKLEKQNQPSKLTGGELMKYQLEGLNWLYYKWFTQKNAILADEMGLGKTIQIIGFLATMVEDWNCYPFLVVVPNSTCPNWRREIKRWAPSLRVVAYYGTRDSREAAFRYELYPEGSRDLRCHIVITSYDAAADDSCRKFFKGVQWQGLIVDEGQRLKNSESQLYSALGVLRAPFKILLTGTPLQNNQRELFNLLQFLDDAFDAAKLEQDFLDLDREKISELHDLIRPFFLRRTKAQVLTFLPPMAQIILPVSMTIVQKKVYRSILAKNPDLMRAIFSTESTSIKQGEKASLNNILMQLRKCLCHPFVYNKSIEDKNVPIATSHRNLVDASSKLKLLEVLLPKLQERGHRVLIFSQFLDMLDIVEDFLDGMSLRYQRLDGSVNTLVKQKRIDEFNAPDSALFAFILSTRAGGVGINLATADTVIILDPDFNPHQDIQALSRAHRIGQTKKVLCFQLVTRASAEERIMQVGRKKLALDHVLIQEMDADDTNETDLVSILRHGANELFDSSVDQDIVYDGLSVDRLLDRSHMEDTQAGDDKTAETQFSFARVWANDHGALEEAELEVEEHAPDPGVWANILKERERVAAEEAAAKAESFGRGRRARAQIDYGADKPEGEVTNATPQRKRKSRTGDESDTDFQAEDSDGDDDNVEGEDDVDPRELDTFNGKVAKDGTGLKRHGKQSQSSPTQTKTPARSQSRKTFIATSATKLMPRASAPLMKRATGLESKNARSVMASKTSMKVLLSKSTVNGKIPAADLQILSLDSSSCKDQVSSLASTSPMRKSTADFSRSNEECGKSGQSAEHPILITDDCNESPKYPPSNQ